MTRNRLDAIILGLAFLLLFLLTYLGARVAALLWLAWQTGWRP